jgi:hypothetical protein
MWKDVRYGTPWRDIRDKYVVSGNPCGLDWPGIVTDRFDKLDAGEDDSTSTLTELMSVADLEIDPYLRTFLADILEIQTTGASDAESEALTRARIDMAAVDSVNEVTQKNLLEGDDVDFLILGDLLLIGYNHNKAYIEYAKAQGAEKGNLVMTEKGDGTIFHRGEVTVKISSGNFDNVKAGIKRFSKKKVTPG